MASAARRQINDALVLEVAGRLTERDRRLCRLLLDHQVLTTNQIQLVGFDSLRRTQLRLDQLYRLRVVDRFRPLAATGSAPHHWVLDGLGAAVLGAERGVDAADLPWRRDRALALATSAQLAHLVGVNGFFCALLAAARRRADAELELWWSSRRCAGAWGSFVRPDGYGVWTEAGRRVAFCFEHDAGTEPLARLTDKLDRYGRLFAAGGQRVPVLFSFPGPGREAEARRVLRLPGAPVATAVITSQRSPDEAIWLPAGTERPRRRLADLGLADQRGVPGET